MVPGHSIEMSHKCDFWGCAKRQPTKRLATDLWVNGRQFKGHSATQPRPSWFVVLYASGVLP